VRTKTLLALLIPLASAGLFVRLGLWQLARHDDLAARNAGLEKRIAEAPRPLGSHASDTAGARWLPVSASGRFRYDLEQVQAGRPNRGSPGVHLLTPFEREGSDTLVIVTRGWVYAADAATADLPRWREADSVALTGYLEPLTPSGLAPPPDPALPLRSANRAALEARLGRPVAPMQIVMTSDSAARADSVPRRLGPPTMDAGPHVSYAFQWFAFALIAVIGGVVLFRRSIVAERAAG